MNKITCIMPLADGQKIKNEVLKGLTKQSVLIDLMVISRPKERFTPIKLTPDAKTERLVVTIIRNLLREYVLKESDEYVLYLDSDVVLQSDHDVEDSLRFLEDNPDIAIAAYDTKGTIVMSASHHIPMAYMLFRKSILSEVMFANGEDISCNCRVMCNQVRAIDYQKGKKWRVEYVDDRKLTEIKGV